VEHKIARVVIGAIDANPLVSCRGRDYLQNRKIKVTTGVLEKESRKLNEVFFHYMETGLPFVTIKYAQTLDGRIATFTGQSQWISAPASRKFAHRLRAEHDAVLVGAGTVIKDNPELTCRLVRGRNPLRVVVDSDLKIPEHSQVLQNLDQAKTIIATLKKPGDPGYKRIAAMGAEILTVNKNKQGRVDLRKLFKILAARQISSVLVEGGAQIITSVLKDNLADRLVAIIAPKIIGKGIEAVSDLHIRKLAAAKQLSVQNIKRMGQDIIIDSRME
jgi:diaminohydroxyphosphoribosylaminopyrimidine deaminase/5-amino-6-(5-phosphoribosylamino)uracil reductase